MSYGLDKLKKETGLTTTNANLKSLRSSLGSHTDLDQKLENLTMSVLPTAAKKLQERKEQTIELINIFDKSGSCGGTEKATMDGYNNLIKKQKEGGYSTIVTTSLFAEYEVLLYEALDIKKVPPLSYRAYGGTALYDTLVTRLTATMQRHKRMGENAPKKTIVTIMTDGKDEHSRRYNAIAVRGVINKCRSLGWEFIFLGARQNAKEVALDLGIPLENAETYDPSNKGVLINFKAVELAIDSVRESGTIDPNWSEIIKRHNYLALGSGEQYQLGGR